MSTGTNEYLNGYLIVMALFAFIFLPVAAGAQEFDVSNQAQFQDALASAQSNNEDDVIDVGDNITITSTLTYTGDSGHTLTINGNGHSLDGNETVPIMRIDTSGLSDDTGSDITIGNLIFKNGNSDTGSGAGLYVRTNAANVSLGGCTFNDNWADKYGGAAYIRTTSGNISLTQNEFNGNYANYNGGGIYMHAYSSGNVSLTNNTFNGNYDGDDGGGAYVHAYTGSITLTNNSFIGNFAEYSGGGTYAWTSTGSITLIDNTFIGNDVYSSDGGGADVESSSGNIFLINNIFSENLASDEGGGADVESDSGNVTLTNNTFNRNSTLPGDGGGVYVWTEYDATTVNIYNNIFWGNRASYDGDDLYIQSDGDNNGATVNLYNNDLDPNSDINSGDSEALYITSINSYHHGGNIMNDPLFVNATNQDFHLLEGSPCIDVGLNSAPGIPLTDFEGDSRIINGTVDMGADEYNGPSTAQYTLTVTKSGTGYGSVNSTGCILNWAGNIGTCTAYSGATITLSGTAEPGSTFGGWSHATGSTTSCTGTGDCTFNLNEDSSVIATFTLLDVDGDADGINTSIEDQVPDASGTGHGDGNGDGTPDSQQANVASLPTVIGSHYATLEDTLQHQIANVSAVNPPSDVPSNIHFPYGMFQFTVQGVSHGGTVTMRLFIPRDTRITGYWKKNQNTGQWENIATSVENGPSYAPDKTVITFQLTDGGAYDEDGVANGFIQDQGGPGFPRVTAVPAMDERGIALFVVLAGLASLGVLRRHPV